MNKGSEHTRSKPKTQQRLLDSGHEQGASSQRSLVFSWVLVFVVAAFIFYMSAKSGDALDHQAGIITFIRNVLNDSAAALFGHPVDVSPVGHFTEFFLLGGVLANALRLSFPLRHACMYAVLIASLYGITDELHQIFVPQRSCDPLDWMVDTLAALIAALLFGLIVNARRKHKDSQVHTA